MKTSKVIWKQLKRGDLMQCGDMFSSFDPNTPEKQSGDSYNLQMQAIHICYYGKPAYDSQFSEGTLWRPVGVESVERVWL